MQAGYEQMIKLLRCQRNLVLVGHEDPDCDCLGSMLALYRAFDGAAKNWRMLRRDPVPPNLRFLPGLDLMLDPSALDMLPEAVLLVDCGELSRTGDWLEPMLRDEPLYCIDHHATNAFEGAAALVEPEAAAAAELAAALIFSAGIQPDKDTALCLYCGLAADTGCFRYLNTTPRSLRQAARLMPQVDLELVRIKLFEDRSFANLKMMAACLNNLTVDYAGLLCYSYVSRPERDRYHATAADCHNIVNYTLALTGVKVGILFEEYENEVKISFRCRRGYRVDELAQQFQGGGHLLASGCKVAGSLDQAMPLVVAEARKLFQPEV